MTTRIKNYPFEVPIAGNPASVVLADQVKSLDWEQLIYSQWADRRKILPSEDLAIRLG